MTHPSLDRASASTEPTDNSLTASPDRFALPAIASAALCLVLALAMHLPWCAITPLAGTEAHRVLPARAMVQNHWWMIPTLYGKPFMTKPPGHYWIIAAAQLVAGHDSLLAWRAPSALAEAALCAAIALFGARWFGRRGGVISGLCGVGLVALWGQAQTADIDAANTLAAALAGLIGLECFFGQASEGRTARGWTLLAALSWAAMFMIKGPAGLPLTLGVWLWAIVWNGCHGRFKVLCRPEYWAPIVGGLLVFGLYGIAARHSLAEHHATLDQRGLTEGLQRMSPRGAGVLLKSVGVMLPQVVLFAMPMSASLLFYRDPTLRSLIPQGQKKVAMGLAGSVICGWVICVLSGMVNPRYAYMTYVPLCPLTAIVVLSAMKAPALREILRVALIVLAIALPCAAVILAELCWKSGSMHGLLIASIAASIAILSWTLPRLRRRQWAGAFGLVGLLAAVSVAFGVQRHISRTADSGIGLSQLIQAYIGPSATVATGETIVWKPEIFYYTPSTMTVEFYPYTCWPENVKPRRWVVLDSTELKQWKKTPGVSLTGERRLTTTKDNISYYVAWYADYHGAGPIDHTVHPDHTY